MATSVSMNDNSSKEVVLERIPYIHYPVRFLEGQGQEQIKVLLDSGNKINAMSLAYVERLGFKIWKTNVKVQKIDDSALKTFRMVIADFQMEDKGGRPRFF